jgi:uncharacterized membrane protein
MTTAPLGETGRRGPRMADLTASREPAETERAAADRLAFFSDAVVAIAITLLALDLPIPTGHTNAELLRSAGQDGDDYLAFVISFLVISVHWRGHHRLFRYFMAAPPAVVWWNLLWLMMIVLTPFATRVLTRSDDGFEVRFAFYASVQALAALFLLLSLRVIARRHLLDPQAPPALVPEAVVGLGTIAISFLVSIPLVFVLASWAYLCWAVGPMLQRLVWRRRPPPVSTVD